MPQNLIYVIFNQMISPFYGNSVLANLNAREFIRVKAPAGMGDVLQLDSVAFHQGLGVVRVISMLCMIDFTDFVP